MDKTLRQIFDWSFIAGIVGSAAWLLFTMFNRSMPGRVSANTAAKRRELGVGSPSRL